MNGQSWFALGVLAGIVGVVILATFIVALDARSERREKRPPKPNIHEILAQLDALERANTEQWLELQAVKRDMHAGAQDTPTRPPNPTRPSYE